MKTWGILGYIAVICFVLWQLRSADFGLTPKYYRNGEKVDLLVNKVESDHTQLPYGYYDLKFVCPHSQTKKPLHLSLGEILRGDRLWESDYKLQFGQDIQCARLCDFNAKDPQIKFADNLIKNGYVAHWSIDGLPGATTFVSSNKNSKYYAAGFPLGFFKGDLSYLYNHFMLVIRYHTEKSNPSLHTIVGFEVYPKLVVDETCPGSSKEYDNLALTLKKPKSKGAAASKLRIPYTYSVYWREDNSVDYDHRWELYYANDTNKHSNNIHWISFFNSVVLLVLVSLITAIIMIRLFKSNGNTTTLPLTNDSKERPSSAPSSADSSPTADSFNRENYWKSLGVEVTKKPPYSLLLAVVVSSGIQLIIATTGVITAIIIKTQFESNRSQGLQFNNYQGALTSFTLSCFVLSGIIPSFFGTILFKIFNNDNLNQEYPSHKAHKLSLILSGFLPCLVLSFMLFFNFFVFAKESSNALPFGTIVVLLLLFFLIVLPLGMIGGYYGNKTKFSEKSFLLFSSKSKDDFTQSDIKTSTGSTLTARRTKFCLTSLIKNSFFVMVIYGLIPFGIVYVELSFIFNSIWLEKTTFYYMYGFLFLTIVMLTIVVCESSLIGLYVNLIINNNPNWQWLCFRIGSSIGLYIYGYSFYYFFSHLHVADFVSILLYFGYMGLVSLLIAIACGSMSVLTGLVFIRKLYGSTKVD